MASRHDIDEKWEQYPCTVLEFCQTSIRIDLREPMAHAQRAALRAAGLSASFAILTAENPWGENVEDEPTEEQERARKKENARRSSNLEAELTHQNIRFHRVDGVAPDGEYREHLVAAVLDREHAVALARRLRQLAIFWFDGDSFWLVPVLAEKAPERLPRD
jgi:hypothetical protein